MTTENLEQSSQAARERSVLLVTTSCAVLADALLIPFYPRLFARAFHVTDPEHVGLYLAATCLTVMLVLPVWARAERRFSTLQILLWGQGGAGVLSLLCHEATSTEEFWCLSLLMVACKASYLLVYPYVMRLTPKSEHTKVVGLLTVIVHVGGVFGAVLGGLLLDHFAPQRAFLLMAASDFVQMVACVILLVGSARRTSPKALSNQQPKPTIQGTLSQLGAVMLLFYFSVFVIRPFFVSYWEARTSGLGDFIAGWVFSIPAWMSIACLIVDRFQSPRQRPILHWFSLAALGLALQALDSPVLILLGRCAFGWAAFRTMVRLDVLLFELSSPGQYARNFSRMNFCQQLGVLFAFSGAGSAVARGGLTLPFIVAGVGLSVAAAVYYRFFRATASRDPGDEGSVLLA